MQPQADPFIVPVCHAQLEILYADEHLLLINKPGGLLTLSGKHPLNQDSVHFRLVQRYPTATLLHRLDFGTSGIMLVALNKQINGQLTRQFQERRVEKSYTAILHGHLAADEGRIDLPIAKGDFPLQKICHETGKPALTHYRVIERLPPLQAAASAGAGRTRVLFRPLSGRTHQLRIHSREIGHPILGCDLYASDAAFFMAQRLMLHATSLTFEHPVSGEPIHGVCPCPF